MVNSSRLFNNNQLTPSATFGFGDSFSLQTTDNATKSVNVLFDEKYKKSRDDFDVNIKDKIQNEYILRSNFSVVKRA